MSYAEKYHLIFILIFLVIYSVQCNVFSRAWNRALIQTLKEQEIEDQNAIHKIDNHLVRRLIVMPLSGAFKPNRADLMHGKIQYGDKCSLPTSIGRLIFEKRYEVPWLFELVPVKNEEKIVDSECGASKSDASSKKKLGTNKLEKVYISPLDFRSPENYIFMPSWMMKDLNLKANDLVDISFVRIKLADLVVFQPLSLDWLDLMEANADPKSLLEHEINKYSSLTAGSTIYIEKDGIEYPLYVKETFAEGSISVKAVRVQDSDIRTDIDGSILEKLKEIRDLEAENRNVGDDKSYEEVDEESDEQEGSDYDEDDDTDDDTDDEDEE